MSRYSKQHERVRKVRGKATDYGPCVDCEGEAREWSWIHDLDPDDVNSYEPRCKKCHVAYDRMSEWIKAAWDNGSYDGKVGTPEQAAKISKAIKASWSNLEVRQKRIEGIKASDINPPEGHARRVEYARTRKRDSKGRFPKG